MVRVAYVRLDVRALRKKGNEILMRPTEAMQDDVPRFNPRRQGGFQALVE